MPRIINPGDCVMVHRTVEPASGDPYIWRFLAVVIDGYPSRSGRYYMKLHTVVPMKNGGHDYLFRHDDEKNEVFVLEPDNWPDGLHQIRMQLILTGQLAL